LPVRKQCEEDFPLQVENVIMKALKCLVLAGAMFLGMQACADTLTINWSANSQIISGSYQPVAYDGNDPYLTIKFSDTGTTNLVRMDIFSNMAVPADVDKVSFNIIPDELASYLTLTSNKSANIVGLTQNTNEGPIHTFDLAIDTGQGQSGIGAQEVGFAYFTVTNGTPSGYLPLTAGSFAGTTTYNGVEYMAAAHFQNVGPNGNDSSFVGSSGYNPVPGPGVSTPLPTAALSGFGLLGGLGFMRRRSR
jgi:hypothetical protein